MHSETTFEPDDFEELNRNEALDYMSEVQDNKCPRCGGELIEDDGLQCQTCDWRESDNEIKDFE